MNYLISGLHVRSAVVVPAATPTDVGNVRVPDVTIRVESQIDVPSDAHFQSEGIIAGDRDFLLRPINGLSFRIRHGREIVISRMPGIPDRDVHLFLMGSAWGVLCHQRGLLPLHCSAVNVGRRVYMFLGPSGAGKSTLAAGLNRRGYEHFCDDVCIVQSEYQGLTLWPMPKGLKLWRDAADALGFQRGEPVSSDSRLDKYFVSLPGSETMARVDHCALYLLSNSEASELEISKVHGSARLGSLLSNVYRGEWLSLIRDPRDLFREVALMAKHLEVYRFSRPRDLSRFDEGLDLLVSHMEAAGGKP